jgi:hypothetical protein
MTPRSDHRDGLPRNEDGAVGEGWLTNFTEHINAVPISAMITVIS